MLATFILDAYKNSEKNFIAQQLEDLLTNNCWSTAGIYCYWDFYTKETLYIGLATDLLQRFLQHNSMVKVSPSTCKSDQIKEYFSHQEKLGFSIVLQSSLSQPLTRKQRIKNWEFWQATDKSYKAYFGSDGLDNIRLLEGISIEAFKQIGGFLPKWNSIGGSVDGRVKTEVKHQQLIKLLTNQEVNNNVSRASLREINFNGYGMYECFLHGIRINLLPFERALEFNRKIGNEFIIDSLLDSGYLKKKLIVG